MRPAPKPFDPRQEMDRPDFEIQYKRDIYLKDVQLHHHDFYELYFLVSGDVTYTIESGLCRVCPGDMLLISPRELHQVYIRPEQAAYERYVLWVDPKVITRLSTPQTDLMKALNPAAPGYGNQLRLPPEEQANIRRLMEALYTESHREDYGSDLLRSSLLQQILVTINRLAQQGDRHYEQAYRSSRTISDVIDYVNRHYGEPLSLDLLAERFFVSKYHLSHEFQRQVGTSLYRYIQKKRLLIARQLLQEGKKPGEVYSSCGFRDYAGFYRAFRAQYGTTPRAYAASRYRGPEAPEDGISSAGNVR